MVPFMLHQFVFICCFSISHQRNLVATNSGSVSPSASEATLGSAPDGALELLTLGRDVLLQRGPNGAVFASDTFDQALKIPHAAPSLRIELLQEAAFVRSLLKQPRRALEARQEAWSLQQRGSSSVSMTGLDRAQTYFEIAQLEHECQNYASELESLAEAWEAMGPPSAEGRQLAIEILAKGSEALECSDQPAKAWSRLEQALALRHGADVSVPTGAPVGSGRRVVVSPSRLPSDDLHGLLRTAHRAAEAEKKEAGKAVKLAAKLDTQTDRRSGGLDLKNHADLDHTDADNEHENSAAVPAELRRRELVRELLSRGPWTHPQQLPKEFLPGLTSQPWHSVGGGGDESEKTHCKSVVGELNGSGRGGGSAAETCPSGAVVLRSIESARTTAARTAATGSSSEPSYPFLAPVVALLANATDALRSDLQRVHERGLLLPEDECIETKGSWGYHTISGFWVRDQDGNGCSAASPAACALVAQIEGLDLSWPASPPPSPSLSPGERIEALGSQVVSAAAEEEKEEGLSPPRKLTSVRLQPIKVNKVRVLRGSFSVLGPGAHLHPHCGPTNARLKFHLGLETPRHPKDPDLKDHDNAAPASARGGESPSPPESSRERGRQGDLCARMRVGNETRFWRRGEVLFFDDSYEHEVWNSCLGDRQTTGKTTTTKKKKKKKKKTKKMKKNTKKDKADGLEIGLEGGSRAIFQLVIAHPDLVGTAGG